MRGAKCEYSRPRALQDTHEPILKFLEASATCLLNWFRLDMFDANYPRMDKPNECHPKKKVVFH